MAAGDVDVQFFDRDRSLSESGKYLAALALTLAGRSREDVLATVDVIQPWVIEFGAAIARDVARLGLSESEASAFALDAMATVSSSVTARLNSMTGARGARVRPT